ncbi:MAG: hypothetical protein LBT25_08820 [Candidatus Symbiothrix sp.]|jgi:hypothetical protein|nr:hypothetical protein [Candidatus Symbiothrix sp.]
MEHQKIVELFAESTLCKRIKWDNLLTKQHCPFIRKKCVKTRKSEASVAIGTCTVAYGKNNDNVIICPHRLIENNQIFLDCIHLLTLHEPGNELHIISEISIPGGSVDYVLASVKDGKVKDFAGIELQTLDTTGSVWGYRQSFLESIGIKQPAYDENATFGMNWKMTAKTILVQMHHKISTFENLNKHLVLVLQNCLMSYMKKEFSFGHISTTPKIGDSFHFHSYQLIPDSNKYRLSLLARASTNADGIARCLGLKAEANVDLDVILKTLESKISRKTLLRL